MAAALSLWCLFRSGPDPGAGTGNMRCGCVKGPYLTVLVHGDDKRVCECSNAHKHLLGQKMDLNHAVAEDLAMLSGIGEITARRIIEEREANEGFKSMDEALGCPGLCKAAKESLIKWARVE